MVRIGIELSHVIRDFNTQFVKYYKKDINKAYDLESVIPQDVIITDEIKFNSKFELDTFMFVDYPYELFGCANPIEKNLPTLINQWMYDMTNIEGEEYEIVIFSLKEKFLSIQSSFHFLSKIGSRVRKVIFPKNAEDVWNECDVVITVDNNIIESKKDDKKLVIINKPYNQNNISKSDLNYNSLTELIEDNDFFNKI